MVGPPFAALFRVRGPVTTRCWCRGRSVHNILYYLRMRCRFCGEAETQVIDSRLGESRDAVAYIRFASVYRKFEDVREFEAELERLERIGAEPPLQREHLFELAAPVPTDSVRAESQAVELPPERLQIGAEGGRRSSRMRN